MQETMKGTKESGQQRAVKVINWELRVFIFLFLLSCNIRVSTDTFPRVFGLPVCI